MAILPTVALLITHPVYHMVTIKPIVTQKLKPHALSRARPLPGFYNSDFKTVVFSAICCPFLLLLCVKRYINFAQTMSHGYDLLSPPANQTRLVDC
jgi:hypothetical protein